MSEWQNELDREIRAACESVSRKAAEICIEYGLNPKDVVNYLDDYWSLAEGFNDYVQENRDEFE